MSTQSANFVYTPTSSGTYTWRFRRVHSGANTPASSYTLDNLKVSYVIPYTRTECPETDLAYRFGFNGQEKESDMYGESNVYEFKFRILDARIGRFLSQDPLFKEYPWNSPYAFAENDVISCKDLEGLEKAIVVRQMYEGRLVKTTVIQVPRRERIFGDLNNAVLTINGRFDSRSILGNNGNAVDNRSRIITNSNTQYMRDDRLTSDELTDLGSVTRNDGNLIGSNIKSRYQFSNFEKQFPTDIADYTVFKESLTDNEKSSLQSLADIINSGINPNVQITVIGNTSDRPTTYQSDGSKGPLSLTNNIPLSLDRAKAVKKYLTDDLCIPTENINTIGAGSNNPKTNNKKDDANQRTEIKVGF